MRRMMRFLFSRMVLVTVLILLQLGLLLGLAYYLSTTWVYAYWILEAGSLAVVCWVLAQQRYNPSYKLAWCVPILLFPLFGGLFYLLFAGYAPSRITLPDRDPLPQDPEAQEQLYRQSPSLFRQAEYVRRMAGAPVYGGTQASYLPLGEDQWRAMRAELARARRFILLEYFIVQPGEMWDSLLEVLRERAGAGVEVYLLYDDLGCIQTLPAGYGRVLEEAGLRVRVFNPFRPRLSGVWGYRDHRKITVIDGEVGFCGGVNLADEYINAYPKHGHWKDTAVLLRGEAVQSLTRMFCDLWEASGGAPLPVEASPRRWEGMDFVQPFGDSPMDRAQVAETVYRQMISRAQRYVYAATPYLILDYEMVEALSAAAQSGVDVRLVVPHVADKWFVHMVTQSFYLPLAEAGVHIYEYTPGFIHAKMMVCDDEIAVVGTANMDYRSFYMHFECGVLFYGHGVADAVRRDILSAVGASWEVTPAQARLLAGKHRLLRALLRAFAPLM